MQLNQPEYMKEKPFCKNVSMEEQGDKYLLLFLVLVAYINTVHTQVGLFTASQATHHHIHKNISM